MVKAEMIADVMGLSCKIHSLYELTESVTRGLPKKSLKVTVTHVTKDAELVRQISNQLVPPASFKRRKGVLSVHESERVERLARLYATALDVWGDEEDARQFLFNPHALLNGKKPIEMAFTELGVRQVEHILEKLRYGLPV